MFNSSILPDWLGKGLKYLAGLSNDTEWILLLGELLKHEARLGYVVGVSSFPFTFIKQIPITIVVQNLGLD